MFDIHKIPIGIYEKALPNYFSWDEKFRCAQEAGFAFIEISVDESDERLARLDWTDEQIDDLRKTAQKYGMGMPTMCLSGHRRFPFGSKDPQIRQKAHEIMEKAILLARKLGIRVIQLAAYDVYYEPSDQQTVDAFLEGMRWSAQMASRAGVTLALEIMDTPFCGTITKALNITQYVDSPYLMIYPDFGNLTQFADDVEGELRKGMGRIVAIHVKETRPNTFKCVPFGEGDVRFVDLFRCAREAGYRGMFLIEMWADQEDDRQTAADKIRLARTFVVDKMRQAGWEV